METPRDIWSKLDDENVKLHNALDLLYAMSEAARYANATDLVWEQLCDIEKDYVFLNEALGAAANEAQSRD